MAAVVNGLKPFFGTETMPLLLTGSGTGAQEAAIVAERMRARVEGHEFEVPGGARLRATASIGLAQAQAKETAAALVQRTDAALYQAKAQGRNRIRTSTP